MNFTPLASSSKGNAYLVESDGVAPLLFECGIPIKRLREKLNFGLSGLAGCLVSHCHMDHAKAVKDLLKAGVNVYASFSTAETLGVEDHHRIFWLHSRKETMVDDWTVLAFELNHDVPCQGFLIEHSGERLLFIPDTGWVENRFQGVTILAIECNNIEELLSASILNGGIPAVAGRRIRRNHMSLERVVSMLKANDLSRCREIWLLHLSAGNSDEARMIKAVREATGIPCRVCNE